MDKWPPMVSKVHGGQIGTIILQGPPTFPWDFARPSMQGHRKKKTRPNITKISRIKPTNYFSAFNTFKTALVFMARIHFYLSMYFFYTFKFSEIGHGVLAEFRGTRP